MSGQLAIVVITHNSGEHIEACLRSCPVPPVVIDNASTDDSAERAAPWASVIRNPMNTGFAAAVNQGFRATDAPLVLLLNPDAALTTPLAPLVDEFADSQVGAATGRLRGRGQLGFNVRRLPTPWMLTFELLGINRLMPGNPINRAYRCIDLDYTKPMDVEQPAGAFLLIRRAAWEAAGGFDEGFHPVWFEDVDFCRRLRLRGWKIRYQPGAEAYHYGGHSVNRLSWSCKQIRWYASLLRYSAKSFRWTGRSLVAAAALVGFCLRCAIGIFQLRSIQPVEIYARVAKLAFVSVRGTQPKETATN